MIIGGKKSKKTELIETKEGERQRERKERLWKGEGKGVRRGDKIVKCSARNLPH